MTRFVLSFPPSQTGTCSFARSGDTSTVNHDELPSGPSFVDAGRSVAEARSLLGRFTTHKALQRRLNQLLAAEGCFAAASPSFSDVIRVDSGEVWPMAVFRVNREFVARRFMPSGNSRPDKGLLQHKEHQLLQLVMEGIDRDRQREAALLKLPTTSSDKDTSLTTPDSLVSLRIEVRQALQNHQAVAVTLGRTGWDWRSKVFAEGSVRWEGHGFALAVSTNVRAATDIHFGSVGKAKPDTFYDAWLPSLEETVTMITQTLERGSYPRIYARPLGEGCYELGALDF